MTSSAETVLVPPRSRRRGRIWIWVGVAAAVLLITAAVGITIVLNRYEPLENGSVFGVDGARFQRVGSYTDSGAVVFRYKDSDVATVKFGLRNGGRWAVRVERLLDPFLPDAENLVKPLQPVKALTGPLITETRVITPPLSRYQSFEPFTLEPGEERLMAIQFRFEDCANVTEGRAFVTSTYSVRYSTLWVRNEMEVAFPYHLVIDGPIEDCPRQS